MGLMDKLKGAVKAVTGGAAKVTIEYNPPVAMPGEAISVKVTATSTGGEVKSKGIFIDLKATESIHIRKNQSAQLESDLHDSNNTFSQEFQISNEFVLGANETQTWEGTVTLPHNVQPSYQGSATKHEWGIRGRVEARGNDPDSGFQPLRVGLKG